MSKDILHLRGSTFRKYAVGVTGSGGVSADKVGVYNFSSVALNVHVMRYDAVGNPAGDDEHSVLLPGDFFDGLTLGDTDIALFGFEGDKFLNLSQYKLVTGGFEPYTDFGNLPVCAYSSGVDIVAFYGGLGNPDNYPRYVMVFEDVVLTTGAAFLVNKSAYAIEMHIGSELAPIEQVSYTIASPGDQTYDIAMLRYYGSQLPQFPQDAVMYLCCSDGVERELTVRLVLGTSVFGSELGGAGRSDTLETLGGSLATAFQIPIKTQFCYLVTIS